MKRRLSRLFGVTASGRPSLPNSRRQLLIGGIVCFALWPGIGLALLVFGLVDDSERIYAFVSPWLVVTMLGVYLIGQALLATGDRPKFEKASKKRQSNKESK